MIAKSVVLQIKAVAFRHLIMCSCMRLSQGAGGELEITLYSKVQTLSECEESIHYAALGRFALHAGDKRWPLRGQAWATSVLATPASVVDHEGARVD